MIFARLVVLFYFTDFSNDVTIVPKWHIACSACVHHSIYGWLNAHLSHYITGVYLCASITCSWVQLSYVTSDSLRAFSFISVFMRVLLWINPLHCARQVQLLRGQCVFEQGLECSLRESFPKWHRNFLFFKTSSYIFHMLVSNVDMLSNCFHQLIDQSFKIARTRETTKQSEIS